MTIFTGFPLTPPISTFFSSESAQPVPVPDVVLNRKLNVEELQVGMHALRPVVQNMLANRHECARASADREELATVFEEHYVLVVRNAFHKGEKILARWHGLRRVTKAGNGYVY